jgi:hypothetical protein
MSAVRRARRTARSAGCASVAVVAVLGVMAEPAAADGPPPPRIFTVTGSDSYTDDWSCVDPIDVFTAWNEQVKVFFDADGNRIRRIITGWVVFDYSNPATGMTYSPPSSGPATMDILSGQTVVRGANGSIYDAGGVLVATAGRIVMDHGYVTSAIPHATSVCDALGTQPDV